MADYEKPEQLPDGRLYQVFRVESRFFQPFDLSRFPFDKHDLSIVIEDKDNIADFMACPLWIECRVEEFTCPTKTTRATRLEYMLFMEVLLSFFLSISKLEAPRHLAIYR